jgi:hypothetical protein
MVDTIPPHNLKPIPIAINNKDMGSNPVGISNQVMGSNPVAINSLVGISRDHMELPHTELRVL